MDEQVANPAPKRRWLAFCLSTMLVLTTLTASQAICDETSKFVNASDLLKTVQVIGTLGKPLGELATIRGTWHRVQWKDATAVFRVSHIDGKPTTAKVEFKNNRVTPFDLAGEPGPVRAASSKGISWDWTARSSADHQPPKADQVQEDEAWELLGVERGDLVFGFSQALYDEIGGPVVAQRPIGFDPSFTFIAVRRIAAKK